jgi:hypothetical protein
MGRFRVWSARLAGCGVALAMALTPVVTNPAVVRGFDPTKAPEIQDRLFSGFASFELSSAQDSSSGSGVAGYTPRGSQDCGGNLGNNVRVNQGCMNISDSDVQGRAQAQNETSIAINPNDSNQLIASQNDYRRGDGNCYSGFSTDNGRTWNDSTVPMSFTRGRVPGVVSFGASREYWQAGGDTSVAWDTKGNAYLSCQVFNRGPGTTPSADVSSAFLLFRSQNHGASWNFPGRYIRVSADVTNGGTQPFLDKQLLTVDNNAGSPFQDRVYVTWTEFAADGTAYIYEANSADYGENFSAPHLVSGNAAALCGNTYGIPTPQGNCNENQFSQPFTGPDGNLYVVWDNYNNVVNGGDNRNQMLLAKSIDGGNTFSLPIKVSDFYDLPDCATYQGGQDPGRACVPEKGTTQSSVFRATNYPSGAVDPTNPSRIVVTFGSYINRHSNEANGCVPTGFSPTSGQNLFTGVKTAGACNNDILISVSADGGATFTGTATDPRTLATATPDASQATTDQWWQWIAFTKNGKLATSYYDRQYGTDETTGWSDLSLSGTGDLVNFAVNRVTSSSMPPPTQFSGTFFGDYTGLAADNNAHPFWMDTRNPDLFTCGTPPSLCTASTNQGGQTLVANDQDVYTANQSVPSR